METTHTTPRRRVALLVDVDNANPAHRIEIERRAQRHGTVSVREGFGRHESTKWTRSLKGAPALKLHTQPDGGKNAADITLAAHAAKLACTAAIDVIAIASADRDFAGLAHFLRAEGLTVVVIAETARTSNSLRTACTHFEALDVPEEAEPSKLHAFLEIVRKAAAKRGKWMLGVRVAGTIRDHNPNMRWKDFGRAKFSTLVRLAAKTFPSELEVNGQGNAIQLRLK